MAKIKHVEGKTPSGGDYSEILFFDDDMNPVDEENAAKCVIRELKSDGTLVGETVGFCN